MNRNRPAQIQALPTRSSSKTIYTKPSDSAGSIKS
jgi:hypothetical protein